MKKSFRLRQTIKNPSPDRRRLGQTVWAMAEWKEGSIWVLTKGNRNIGDRLELRGAHGCIDEDDERFALLRERMEPVELLEFGDGNADEAAESFRAFMAMAESDARSVLANLYFRGKVSMVELQGADQETKELDENIYDAFYT